MRILVLGAAGRLATEFIRVASQEGHSIFAFSRKEVDITSRAELEKAFSKSNPDVVLNFAAYTKVDEAETTNGGVDATLVNIYGTKLIASICAEYKSKLCHISTGFVFDGSLPITESYSEDADTGPINKYGITKLFSEKVIVQHIQSYFIIRTNWLFGSDNDFLSKTIKAARENKKVCAISDQYGSFTYIKDLAIFCLKVIETEKYGIYNYANSGHCTPYDFIKYALASINLSVAVDKTSCDEFDFIAPRQKNLSLSTDKVLGLGFSVPPWQSSLELFLKENYLE